MRRTAKARRALTAVAITTGLALTVVGCGGEEDNKSKPGAASSPSTKKDQGSEPQDQAPAADSVLAEVKGSDNITLVINSAVRDTGGFVTVNGKVKNGSGKYWIQALWAGNEQELVSNSASMAGASLVDTAGKKKYLILRDTDGRCLCTRFTGGFKANEEKTFYAQFPAPPAGTTKVDFQIADMPPATIEISEGE
ncbi:hypothetical protein GCM10020367_40690 [Streptomyces sannanensis]|uniref:Lipoprotein n=1 Tax=Streptomyces sannanensis TaxID=285536 RepID=A0ABP6SFK7_9ACTN